MKHNIFTEIAIIIAGGFNELSMFGGTRDLSDAALELVAWRRILKRFLGVRAFDAVERAVFDELRSKQ